MLQMDKLENGFSSGGTSYELMRAYVDKIHPRTEAAENEDQEGDHPLQPFDFRSANLGQLQFETNYGQQAISECEKEVGLGVTLYFRQLKVQAILFLALTLVGTAQMVHFWNFNLNSISNFMRISIGNIADPPIELICHKSPIKKVEQQKITLECEQPGLKL